jgi:hypothetical protein
MLFIVICVAFFVAAAKPWVNFAMKSLDGWKMG